MAPTKSSSEAFLKSCGLSVAYDTDRGRSLVTDGPRVAAGRTLMRCLPFAAALNSALWGSHCFCCFRGAKSAPDAVLTSAECEEVVDRLSSPCEKCGVARYCSPACKDRDAVWHEEECSCLQRLQRCAEAPQVVGHPENLDDVKSEALLLGRTIRRLTTKDASRKKRYAASLASAANCRRPGSSGGDETIVNTPGKDHGGCEEDSESVVFLGGTAGDVNGMCCPQGLNGKRDALSTFALAAESGLLPKVALDNKLGVVKLLLRFQANNFQICDALLNSVGSGVYPMGSLMNHSCVPNAVVTFEPQSHIQVVRSLRPLSASDDLMITYTELAAPTVVRQQHLQEGYGFVCDCSRCRTSRRVDMTAFTCQEVADDTLSTSSSEEEEDENREPRKASLQSARDEKDSQSKSVSTVLLDDVLLADWKGVLVENSDEGTRKTFAKAKALASVAENDRSATSAQKLHGLLAALRMVRRVAHPLSLQLYTLRGKVMTAALEAGSLEVAVRECLELVRFLREIYADVGPHPMLAINLMTLADLHNSLAQKESALEVFKEALAVCEVSFGRQHAHCHLLRLRLCKLQRNND